MKVRFYCDMPPYANSEYKMFASSSSPAGSLPEGWKRIAFDVDFPPEVVREYDTKAPAVFKGEVAP